jgi:hypothetical protein
MVVHPFSGMSDEDIKDLVELSLKCPQVQSAEVTSIETLPVGILPGGDLLVDKLINVAVVPVKTAEFLTFTCKVNTSKGEEDVA